MEYKMWNERFSVEQYFYGKMPNDFLIEAMSSIPQGKVLCLADGEGRNSTFLARGGYSVTAVDFSDVALEKAKKLASENGVEVEYVHADLSEFPIEPEQWDGIISIFCHLEPELRRKLHERCVAGLKPGGAFVLEAYHPDQLRHQTGGPRDRALLMDLPMLKQDLAGLNFELERECERIIFEGIAHNGPSAVVQVIAKKPR